LSARRQASPGGLSASCLLTARLFIANDSH
jgi:hypothetical protein